MEIHHQLMFGGGFEQFFQPVLCRLRSVVFEKIDFHPRCTPTFVGGKQFFRANAGDVFRVHPKQ